MEDSRPVTILIADDDEDDRFMAGEAFGEARLVNELHFVEDGEELLDYLKARGKYADRKDKSLPGLLLLDLNMPRMDGREALIEIKTDPRLRQIPVIVLTESKSEEDIISAYNLGIDSYITKPVTFAGLVEVMRTLSMYWLNIVNMPGE